MSPEERRRLASELTGPVGARRAHNCPFQALKPHAECKKKDGVCSLRLYELDSEQETDKAKAKPVEGARGAIRVTCPYRFHQNLDIVKWVGAEILKAPDALIASEVGFLEANKGLDSNEKDDVGRLDMILVARDTPPNTPLNWTALEIQAVYFSGDKMTVDIGDLAKSSEDYPLLPKGKRRPDYRSSGPKRLMPQLQIKVPTLRRWGKKMAVVVDKAFFDSIGQMDHVSEISNADIAWFIVRIERSGDSDIAKLVLDSIRFTTLERSVEGLTGGQPVPLPTFESRIREKLRRGEGRVRPVGTRRRKVETPELDF